MSMMTPTEIIQYLESRIDEISKQLDNVFLIYPKIDDAVMVADQKIFEEHMLTKTTEDYCMDFMAQSALLEIFLSRNNLKIVKDESKS